MFLYKTIILTERHITHNPLYDYTWSEKHTVVSQQSIPLPLISPHLTQLNSFPYKYSHHPIPNGSSRVAVNPYILFPSSLIIITSDPYPIFVSLQYLLLLIIIILHQGSIHVWLTLSPRPLLASRIMP